MGRSENRKRERRLKPEHREKAKKKLNYESRLCARVADKLGVDVNEILVMEETETGHISLFVAEEKTASFQPPKE